MRSLLTLSGSRMLVVHGRDVPMVNPSPGRAAAQVERWETKEIAQELVDTAVSELQAAGVEMSGRVLPGQGHMGTKILHAAEEEGADLFVLGPRGMSRLEEVMIGSVLHKIVHTAKCPVLLVRYVSDPLDR